jgi:hypothetical protein
MITIHTRLIILWIMLLIGMILHFNYHISGIVYGVDVKKTGADGTIPASLVMIRTAFYHLPIVFVALLLYVHKKWFAITMAFVSVVYALAHAGHLAGEIRKTSTSPDYSQLCLLCIVCVLSIILSAEHFNLLKQYKPETRSTNI